MEIPEYLKAPFNLNSSDILSNLNNQSFVPDIPKIEINKEDTFAYKTQQNLKEIIDKSNTQIKLSAENVKQLQSNYKKLEELYNLKEKEFVEAKQESKRSKKIAICSFIISIISTLIAIGAWLFPR